MSVYLSICIFSSVQEESNGSGYCTVSTDGPAINSISEAFYPLHDAYVSGNAGGKGKMSDVEVGEDGELKSIKLANGYNMPILGLGTWQIDGIEVLLSCTLNK